MGPHPQPAIGELIDPEALGELGRPLSTEVVRRKDDDPRIGLVVEALPDQRACLDGLPETYLVCQEITAGRILGDLAHDGELMVVQLDGAKQQAICTDAGTSLPEPLGDHAEARLVHRSAVTTQHGEDLEGIVDGF